jgi:hypothetical protein
LLLAAFFFVPNEMIRMVLTQFDLIYPLTQRRLTEPAAHLRRRLRAAGRIAGGDSPARRPANPAGVILRHQRRGRHRPGRGTSAGGTDAGAGIFDRPVYHCPHIGDRAANRRAFAVWRVPLKAAMHPSL